MIFSRDVPLHTRANFMQTEPAMKRTRSSTMAVSLLIGIGLILSACTQSFDPGKPILRPGLPYGSVDLVGWR
jgi:hypothetical protein